MAHCPRRKNSADCSREARMSTRVVREGNDVVEGRGCREYVNCTVEGEERCSVRDIALWTCPHSATQPGIDGGW